MISNPSTIPPSYHPSYSSPDADIVLSSTDAVRFRVHSLILRLASEVFRGMLEMPTPRGAAPAKGDEDVVPMDEHSTVVAGLLALIYPDGIFPTLASYDFVSSLLRAADKYEMAGATSCIRSAIGSSPFAAEYPLHFYVVACRYGWREEAVIASGGTLAYNLFDPVYSPRLEELDGKSLLALMKLQKRRKDLLISKFRPGCALSARHVSDCGIPAFHTFGNMWQDLTFLLSCEMDRCSLGTNLRTVEFWDKPELYPLWDSRCGSCGRAYMDRCNAALWIQQCLDTLPKTV